MDKITKFRDKSAKEVIMIPQFNLPDEVSYKVILKFLQTIEDKKDHTKHIIDKLEKAIWYITKVWELKILDFDIKYEK